MITKNPILEHLDAMASLDWCAEQKEYFVQRAKDARPVQCVRMRDVFTLGQLAFLSECYHARQKMCYKNAADLVTLLSHPYGSLAAMIANPNSRWLFGEPVKYVEGFALSCGIIPIEHAFVKVGDKYIDPTFERALKRDVRSEVYVSCIELAPEEMARFQAETGYYGDLYKYAFLKQHRPELAAKMASLRP